MTISVSLTKNELLSILSKHFGIEVVEFNIIESTPSSSPLRQEIEYTMNKEFGPEFLACHLKIACIKHLRSFINSHIGYSMLLSEAKWAIENWNIFIDFVGKYNRIPNLNFNGGTDSPILY